MQAKAAKAFAISIFYPFQVTLDQITNINNIFAENRHLRHELALMKTEMAKLKDHSVENRRLRKLLQFSEEYSYDLVPVRVVARDPSHLYRSVVLNAGSMDSVGKWMPLVNEKGVIGKVIQVLNGISLAQLLRDPSNRTSVITRESRAVGILETENGRDFFIRYRNHEEVAEGDTIITSGLGGIYPRGLMVGYVTKIEDNYNPLFKKVRIKVAVDFDHLEELFIMRLSPQWASFREEFDSLQFEQ
jgi:rod shape-determining protein MreC